MRGLWLAGGAITIREDLPSPDLPEGEALVRVRLAGICATDLELVKGYQEFRGVPGHEFVGVVERGPGPLVGARVVGEINAVCGRCEECRAGRRTHCRRRTVLGIAGRDGAFAERLVLPAENLHRVPDALADEVAVFVEPVAAALAVQEQVEVRPGDRVLVVGDGRLGLLVAQTLALTGCRLVVVGRHPGKLALLEPFGIMTARCDAGAGAIEPRSFDVAVECTGDPGGFATALWALRPRGTLVLKSTYRGHLEIDAAPVVVDEIRIVGSRCGPFEPALRLLTRGLVAPAPMIHARYPLARGVEAFEHAARPGALKVLLEP